MDVLQIVERIGAYSGFAAIIGLAVLSALYFSQARDLKRLRDWAGRAPERTAQPVRPSPAAPRRGPAPGAARTAPPARPAGAPPAPPAASGAAPATQTLAGRQPPAAAPAGEGQAASAENGSSAPAAPRKPAAARPAPPASSRTQVWGAGALGSEAPRSGLAPRYMALIVAGVLIVGAGIAYAVISPGSAEESVPATAPAPSPQQPLVPSQVTVSVLNGTTVPGLAAQIGDKVEAGGFKLGNVTNASERQRAESVILYLPGGAREARAVGRKLRIEQTEQAEPGDRALAGNARVVVVVGADQTE